MSQFYYLEKSRNIDCRAEVRVGREHVPEICALNPEHGRTWQRPGPLVIDGRESDMTPCLWTWLGDCLLDQSSVSELEGSGLKGIVTYPVRIEPRDANPYEYVQVRPGGWGGMAMCESGIRLSRFYECCGHKIYSPLLDPSHLIDAKQWDGSDFFIVWPLPQYIFVSPRARDELCALRLAGLDVIPVSELKAGRGGFTPGRLEHYLSSEYASAIAAKTEID